MPSLNASLPPTLSTSRLHLSLFDYSDAHYTCLLAAMNILTAHANMGDYGIRTPAQFDALNANTRLSSSTCAGRTPDIDVYYLIRVGDKSGPLAGAVSLMQRAESTPPDVGWCILEGFMGRGYAAEAGRELVRMARGELGVKELIAWPGAGNLRSVRVAQKIGFVEGGQVESRDTGVSIVYVLPRMQFDSSMELSLWGEKGSEM